MWAKKLHLKMQCFPHLAAFFVWFFFSSFFFVASSRAVEHATRIAEIKVKTRVVHLLIFFAPHGGKRIKDSQEKLFPLC